jgi:RNA polymerase sigma-70 factor (ECF subfamily)
MTQNLRARYGQCVFLKSLKNIYMTFTCFGYPCYRFKILKGRIQSTSKASNIMEAPVTSKSELLPLARELDPQALAQVYDLYSPAIYRYAMRLLGDTCAAEDCVAETFSRFLQALNTGRGPRDYLQAYLFRTAHNLISDHYRRQPPTEELSENLQHADNTEEAASHNLRQRRVRAALHELTEEQQQVIALKFLEGWDNDDIARSLHKPIGAVKSMQHRALAKLQQILLDEK